MTLMNSASALTIMTTMTGGGSSNSLDRPEQIYGYDMCPLVKDGQECPAGNKCVNSHNVVEQIYGANKYKTKFCKYYPDRL
jgi:hypothetical protein